MRSHLQCPKPWVSASCRCRREQGACSSVLLGPGGSSATVALSAPPLCRGHYTQAWVANRCLAADLQAVACPREKLRHLCFQVSAAPVCRWESEVAAWSVLPAAVVFLGRHLLQVGQGFAICIFTRLHWQTRTCEASTSPPPPAPGGSAPPYLTEQEVMGTPPLPTSPAASPGCRPGVGVAPRLPSTGGCHSPSPQGERSRHRATTVPQPLSPGVRGSHRAPRLHGPTALAPLPSALWGRTGLSTLWVLPTGDSLTGETASLASSAGGSVRMRGPGRQGGSRAIHSRHPSRAEESGAWGLTVKGGRSQGAGKGSRLANKCPVPCGDTGTQRGLRTSRSGRASPQVHSAGRVPFAAISGPSVRVP